MFIGEDVRRQSPQTVERLLAAPDPFIGQESFPKKGDGVVEIRVDPLSIALRKAGLVIPEGFDRGTESVLIAFGDREIGPNPGERVAADAFETALFGRGVEAKNADDGLRRLPHPLTAKTDADTVAQAAQFGVPLLVMGRTIVAAGPEPAASAWRAKAELKISLYELTVSTRPTAWDVSSEAVDVSSQAAAVRALEQSAQEGAARLDGWLKRQRGRQVTLGVLISGRKDPAYLLRLMRSLRRTPGVIAASLVLWRSLDDMALIHAYAVGLNVDELAARLLREDPSLRLESVETEDHRLTLSGPENSTSDDRGW